MGAHLQRSAVLHGPESQVQVLFCGHMMRNAFKFTHEVVQQAGLASTLLVSECSSHEVPHAIEDAHIAVPLMTRFDASLLHKARQLRMVLQFGVGVEGVDMHAVRCCAAAWKMCSVIGQILCQSPMVFVWYAANSLIVGSRFKSCTFSHG
jgi:hypothetical protein